MPPETLLAFITYAFVTSITPGPNNTMLLASGVNYGFVRSLPHVLGISIGFGLMVVGVGAGLGRLFEDYPSLYAAALHRGRRLPAVPGLADRDGRADAGRFTQWPAVRVLESSRLSMGQSQGMDHGDRGHHGVFAHWGGMQAVVLLALLFALVNALA